MKNSLLIVELLLLVICLCGCTAVGNGGTQGDSPEDQFEGGGQYRPNWWSRRYVHGGGVLRFILQAVAL